MGGEQCFDVNNFSCHYTVERNYDFSTNLRDDFAGGFHHDQKCFKTFFCLLKFLKLYLCLMMGCKFTVHFIGGLIA